MSNKIEFIFKIYEIANRHIAENYVNEAKQQLDLKSLKYSFQLITESDINNVIYGEGDDNYSKIMYGGSDSTYPYNKFETIFDGISNRVKGIVPKPEQNLKTNRKNLFERLFSSFNRDSDNLNRVETPNSNEPPNYVEEDGVEIEQFEGKNTYESTDVNEPIVFPVNYTGVIIVHLTIYDDKFQYKYTGGLKEYEHQLKK
jgi:hypothetical protein